MPLLVPPTGGMLAQAVSGTFGAASRFCIGRDAEQVSISWGLVLQIGGLWCHLAGWSRPGQHLRRGNSEEATPKRHPRGGIWCHLAGWSRPGQHPRGGISVEATSKRHLRRGIFGLFGLIWNRPVRGCQTVAVGIGASSCKHLQGHMVYSAHRIQYAEGILSLRGRV